MTSPYDDGWLLDRLADEIRLNDPRTISERQSIKYPADARELGGGDQAKVATEARMVGDNDFKRRELSSACASSSSSNACC